MRRLRDRWHEGLTLDVGRRQRSGQQLQVRHEHRCRRRAAQSRRDHGRPTPSRQGGRRGQDPVLTPGVKTGAFRPWRWPTVSSVPRLGLLERQPVKALAWWRLHAWHRAGSLRAERVPLSRACRSAACHAEAAVSRAATKRRLVSPAWSPTRGSVFVAACGAPSRCRSRRLKRRASLPAARASPTLGMAMHKPLRSRRRATAAACHLLISLAVAALAAVLVFVLWYPGPFRELAGGRELFVLVTSVDVVLGPLLTFAVVQHEQGLAAPAPRPRRHSPSSSSPAWPMGCIPSSSPGPWRWSSRSIAFAWSPRTTCGRRVVEGTADVPGAAADRPAASRRSNSAGRRRAQRRLFEGLAGNDVSSRPIFWQPYEESKAQALAKSRPLRVLLEHYPRPLSGVAGLACRTCTPTSRRGASCRRWRVATGSRCSTRTASVLGYLPVEGFF